MSSLEEELGRVGATLLDPVAKVLLGAVDGIEGVVDAGAGLVGAVGGLFSEDFRDGVQDFIEYDITGNALEKPMDEAGLSKSYFNDTIVEDVARGVGNMLPAVGLAAVTGGVVNPAITMGVSAAGGGMEEAYADGAGYYEGVAYGAASGVLEGATESLVGLSATKTTGLLDDVFKIGSKSVAQTGARRVIGDMVGEAAEEAISALANPALKTIYRGRDALSEYGTPEFLGDVGRSALVGGLTAGVYGATVGHLTHTSGKDADIRGSMEAVDELRREQRSEEHRAWVNGTPIDEAAQNARLEAMRANLANVEKTLQGASPKTRERLIRDYGLSEIVEEDGKLRPNAAARLINEPIDVETEGSRDAGASFDRRYVSPGLWNRRTDVQAELDQINADLRQKYGFEAPEGSASIDNSDAVRYNKKSKLINKTFPPYNESASEANKIATLWAKKDSVHEGNQRLISYKGRWYIIAKYSDMELGYLIVDEISSRDYNKALRRLRDAEEFADRNGGTDTYAESLVAGIDSYAASRGGQGAYHDTPSDGRADLRISHLAEGGSAGESNQSQRIGNYGESSANQQSKVKYSAKPAPDGVPNIEIFDGELSSEAQKNYQQMKKAFSKLSEKTPTGMHFVLVKPNEYINGAILQDGNTVYIAADTLENGTWAQKLVHEVMHFAEGSREYKKLTDFLSKNKGFKHKTAIVGDQSYSTGIQFSMKPDEYPYSMQTVIREYLKRVDEDLLTQAREHRNKQTAKFERVKVCDVSDELAAKIKEFFGLNVKGFTVNINSNGFNHIERRHGINGEADQSMKNLEDLARIGYIIENMDSVEPLIDNGEQVYSSEFNTKENTPAPLVLVKKKINGTYYGAVVATDANYRKLWIQSAFINKKGELTQVPDDRMSPSSTPEAPLPSRSPNNSIPDSESNVKPFAEKMMSGEAEAVDSVGSVSYSEKSASNRKPLYDITKNRRTAHRSSTDVSRPVGYAIKSSPSTNSIPENESNVKAFAEKIMDGEDPKPIVVPIKENQELRERIRSSNRKTTQPNNKEAPTDNGVSRPVGYAIQSASSTNSISETEANVKAFEERLLNSEDPKTAAQLASELGAQMAEEVLGNEEFIGRLVNEDAPLAEKIMGKIRDLISAFSRLSDPAARAEHKRLQKAEKLYLAAVENAGYHFIDGKIEKIKKALANDEEREDAGEISYSAKMRDAADAYRTRIGAWDKKTEGFSFVLGETSAALANLEVNGKKVGKKQVRIDATKVKTILAEHSEMTIDAIKNLPELITEPILILDSKTVEGRLVLVGEVYAENMRPIMVALEIYPTTRSRKSSYDDVVKIASAYPRKNLQRLIETSNVRYIHPNKNRVNDWLKVNRLQLPLPNSQSDSATNSIPDSDEKVNRNGEKISYSLKSFSKQVDDVLSGADTMSTHLKVMDTPKLLQEAGLPDLPILLTAQHLKTISGKSGKKNANYHDLDIAIIKNLPQYIGDPILIADSFTRDDSVVIITEVVDSQKRPVIVAIKLDGNGRLGKKHIKANILTSTYGKDNFQSFLNRIVESDSLIYWNKTKSQDMAVSLGIQFPNAMSKLDSNIIIRKAKAFVKGNEQKSGGNVSYSLKTHAPDQEEKKIVIGMSDGERASILKEKRITPHEIKIAEGFDIDLEHLERNRKSLVEKPLIKKLRDLGALKQYRTDTVDVDFEFTAGGLRKSMNSQVSDYGGNLGDLAKVVMNMQQLLDDAVLLEIHPDKAKGTSRENPQLVQTYVLLSAYRESSSITPVQFEIKQYIDDQNRLYLAVALTKIETGVVGDTMIDKAQSSTRLIPVSDISITQLLSKINPMDENFFKYIPDTLLNREQLASKKRAMEREAKKYGRVGEVKYSLKTHAPDQEEKKIVIGMNDNERYQVLKNRNLSLSAVVNEGKLSDVQKEFGFSNQDIEFSKYGDRVRLFKKLGEEFSVFHRYQNSDISISFSFSKENMRESVSKQRQNYTDFLKMLTCLDDVIDNAIGIEAHNRNAEGYKNDTSLKQVYVLASAFLDGADIVPVKLEVKEFSDKENTLHVAIALESIKQDGIVKQEVAKDGVARQDSPPSNISITDFFKKINPLDESFYKYIPKPFLEQKSGNISYSLKTHAPSPQEEKPTKKAAKEAVRAEKINDLRRTLRERDELYRRTNTVRELAQGMKDLKLGTYHNVAEFNDPRFRGSIEQLASIKIRGNLSVTKTRKVMSDLYDWYDPDSVFFKEQGSIYSQEIRDAMKAIRDGDGMLTIKELDYLEKALRHLAHIVKTYNMVYINGKYVDAKPLADGFVKNAQRAKKVTPGVLSSIMRNRYMQSNVDPAALLHFADGYRSDGFYTVMLEMFRRGEIDAEATEMELLEEWEHFFKKNKGYRKRLSSDTVLYGDKKLSLGDAISLYLTTKRKQAQAGLVYSGFAVEIDGEIQRFAPLGDPEATYTEEEREKLCAYLRDTLYSQFSKADRELISIVEKTMNGKCAEYKRETDLLRMGYTNIDGDDFYYTVIRNNVYKSIDNEGFMEAMDRVTNLSINKDIVKGARGELRILPVDRVFEHHVHQISIYRHLAIPTDTLNRLFNLNVGDNRGQPITVKTETANLPAYEYLKKLKADIEGAPSEPQYLKDLHRAVGWARAKYAIFQLGFNAKTWLTQFSSFFAAGNILRVRSIVRGMGVSAKDVDKYCTLAKLRNHENTAALAEGLLDKIGKVGEFTMKPIGGVDRLVIERLFGACQVEIEANGGAKVGTEENKIEAGKLLERVILETQQNALATERSGLMRSGDELFKSAAMFSADSMKMFGRFLDAWGEYLVLKKELKSTELSDQERADLQNRLKKAKKQVARSTASIVSQAVILAFLASAFRRFYGRKDDEDENGDGVVTWDEFFINVGQDTFGNMIGGLPFYRDIYTYFTDGFEVENFLYSTVNDVLGSVTESFSLIERTMQGKEVASDEVARTVRKAIYAGGQVLGLPTRNLYKLSTGIVSTVSPEAGYTVNSFFNTPNYSADLLNAIEAEDEKRVNTIMGLMMGESFGGLSQNAQNAVRPLLEAGHKVLPKTVGDTVTHDGEEIELTSAQKKRFREINDVSYEVVEDLVKLNQFKKADANEQARALRYVWDTYRALAMDDLLGTDSEQKKVLFAEAIPVEKLAMIVAAAENIKADTDKNGKAIAGTRKKKVLKYIESLHLTAVEKYMVAGYLGFSNKNGLAQVKAHINTLNLSKDEKAKLLVYSGYEAA